MKITIQLLILSSIFACNQKSYPNFSPCRYTVTKDYIESNCYFEQSIVFEEIQIDSFALDSVPVKYSVINFLTIGPINSEDSITTRLYFYKKNYNYEWNYITNSSLHEILPIQIKPDSWYLFRALMINGNPNGKVFIHIDKQFKYNFVYTEIKTGY